MTETDFDPITGQIKVMHINGIEATWHVLKDAIPPRSRDKKNLQPHLNEFIWRCQNKQTNIWDALLECLRDTNYIDDLQSISNTNYSGDKDDTTSLNL